MSAWRGPYRLVWRIPGVDVDPQTGERRWWYSRGGRVMPDVEAASEAARLEAAKARVHEHGVADIDGTVLAVFPPAMAWKAAAVAEPRASGHRIVGAYAGDGA